MMGRGPRPMMPSDSWDRVLWWVGPWSSSSPSGQGHCTCPLSYGQASNTKRTAPVTSAPIISSLPHGGKEPASISSSESTNWLLRSLGYVAMEVSHLIRSCVVFILGVFFSSHTGSPPWHICSFLSSLTSPTFYTCSPGWWMTVASHWPCRPETEVLLIEYAKDPWDCMGSDKCVILITCACVQRWLGLLRRTQMCSFTKIPQPLLRWPVYGGRLRVMMNLRFVCKYVFNKPWIALCCGLLKGGF